MGLLQSSPRQRGRPDRESRQPLGDSDAKVPSHDRPDHAPNDVHRRGQKETSSNFPEGDQCGQTPDRDHHHASSGRDLQARAVPCGHCEVRPQGRQQGRVQESRRGLGGMPALRQQAGVGKDGKGLDGILGASGTSTRDRNSRAKDSRRFQGLKAFKGAVSLLAAAGCFISQLVPEPGVSDRESFSFSSDDSDPEPRRGIGPGEPPKSVRSLLPETWRTSGTSVNRTLPTQCGTGISAWTSAAVTRVPRCRLRGNGLDVEAGPVSGPPRVGDYIGPTSCQLAPRGESKFDNRRGVRVTGQGQADPHHHHRAMRGRGQHS